MKTRVIATIAGVALAAALGGGASWAQGPVYSVNYAGFVQVTIDPQEWVLMANPFEPFPGEDVSFTTVVGNQLATGTAYRWDGVGQRWLGSPKLPTRWVADSPQATQRGTGFWLYNSAAAPAVVMIAGQVPAEATADVYVGAPSALMGNPWPTRLDPTTEPTLAAALPGTRVYRWNSATQAWEGATRLPGRWIPTPFFVETGAGFWYLQPPASVPFTWTSAKPYPEPS